MFVIEKSTYGGIDWHDSKDIRSQVLTSDGSHLHSSHSSALAAVASDVAKSFPDDESKILAAFDSNTLIAFPIRVQTYVEEDGKCVPSGYRDPNVEFFDGKAIYESFVEINPVTLTVVTNYCFGQVDYHTSYAIVEVNCPKYFVIENFLVPAKGVPSVERIYHLPFDDIHAAENYRDSLRSHGSLCQSQIYIACNDLSHVNHDWLEQQIKCINLVQEKHASWYDDSFSIFTKKHIGNLTSL